MDLNDIPPDTLAKLLRRINPIEGYKGAVDTLATIGGQAAAQIPAGLAGIYSAVRHPFDPNAGAETVERVQDKLGGGPMTEAGRENLAKLGESFKAAEQLVPDVAKRGWEKLTEISPTTGATLAAGAAIVDPLKLKNLKRASRAAEKAAQVAEGTTLRGDLEAAVDKVEGPAPELKGFGEGVKKREAGAQARLKAQAEGGPGERAKGAGKREKVEPDIYRKMEEQQGPEAVLAAGARGEHLKPNPEGGYVGAPRTVQSYRDLAELRKRMDADLERAAVALQYADPERMGTWYERTKAAQAAQHEPHQLPRGLEQHSVYSAGVAPESELAFALKHQNSRLLDTGEVPYRGAPARKLDVAVAKGEPAQLSAKVGEYGRKNDPAIEEKNLFGVNDFRHARGMEYTDPAGNLVRAVSPQMHPVMDMETALRTQRANEKALGGRTGWTGAVSQEVPWVYQKAEDIYGRGKRGRFAGGEPGMVAALREANQTIGDYFPKHTFSLTHEAIPGATTGHVPSILEAAPEEKLAYSLTGRWDTPKPMAGWKPGEMRGPAGDMDPRGLGMPESVGAGDRDAISRAVGWKQLPTTRAEGLYTNVLGNVESNPVSIARPLVDFATQRKGDNPLTVNPHTMKALRAQEMLRGAIDAQEAVAGNLPGTMPGRKTKTSMLLESGRTPTAEELRNVNSLLEGADVPNAEGVPNRAVFVSPTSRGMHVMNTADNPQQAATLAKFLRDMGPVMEEAFPGSKAMPSGAQSLYEPIFTDWSGKPTPYGKGEVTTKVLEAMSEAKPNVARNLSESEEVRRITAEKALRDAKLGGTRPDIQKMREFFTNADWNRVVELMRKGMKPAAAMSALGLSLEGMAAENPPAR